MESLGLRQRVLSIINLRMPAEVTGEFNDAVLDLLRFITMNYPHAVCALLHLAGTDWLPDPDEVEGYFIGRHSSPHVEDAIRRHWRLIVANLRGIPVLEKHLDGRFDIEVPDFIPAGTTPRAEADRLRTMAMGWPHRHRDVPCGWLGDYIPVGREATLDKSGRLRVIRTRQLVWNFKYSDSNITPIGHTQAVIEVAGRTAEDIKAAFGTLASRLTLFCIPASTNLVSNLRYREFSMLLCRDTGMTDSFPYIQIRQKKDPVHMGGEYLCNYTLYRPFFRHRLILVFDDIFTTGRSLDTARRMLADAGATVIAARFIGHTLPATPDDSPKV